MSYLLCAKDNLQRIVFKITEILLEKLVLLTMLMEMDI